MMVDATELMPGKTYVIKTPFDLPMEIIAYVEEIEPYIPDGVHLIVLGTNEDLRVETTGA